MPAGEVQAARRRVEHAGFADDAGARDAGVEVREVQRGDGDQAQPLRRVGEVEVGAAVAHVDQGAVGELALSGGEPALHRRGADDGLVRVFQRGDGGVQLVGMLVQRRIVGRPPADCLRPADAVPEHQVHRAADAPRSGGIPGEIQLGNDRWGGEEAHVHHGDLGRRPAPEAPVQRARGRGYAGGVRGAARRHRPDAGEHHHPVALEEHGARPALDLQLAGDREVLRGPAGRREQVPAGKHEDARAVVLDEVRLVHPGDLDIGRRVAGRRSGSLRGLCAARGGGEAGGDRPDLRGVHL